MPNYCDNNVVFRCDDEHDFKVFLEAIRSDEVEEHNYHIMHFNKIDQMPQEHEDQVSGANPPWLVWRIKNWGTKWEIMEGKILHEDENTYSIQFCSAWDPPLGIFNTIRKKFPHITIVGTYNEPAMELYGSF